MLYREKLQRQHAVRAELDIELRRSPVAAASCRSMSGVLASRQWDLGEKATILPLAESKPFRSLDADSIPLLRLGKTNESGSLTAS